MTRSHRLLACLPSAIVTTLLVASALAADPPSGTLAPDSPTLTYTGGPYTGANPSNNIEDEPDCDLVPGTCDDFELTIDLPPGYAADHPDHVILVRVQWPEATPPDDLDVYVQDPATGLSVVSPAATSANPEIAEIPVADGVRVLRVRVLMFFAVGVTFTGTITLGPPPAGTPGTGTYAASTDVWSCNTHLAGQSEIPGPPPTVFDHSNDGEPSLRFDPGGRAFVTAIAGVPAGAGLWVTNDACGQAYEFLGAPDAGIGGGDSDVEVAPEPNVLGFHNIYLSSLTLANITSSFSPDGGNTFSSVTPVSTPVPIDDRQWNAAYGPSICYLSYRNGATQPGNFLEVVRLDYSGLGAPAIAGPFSIWDPNLNPPTASKQLGNMATDKRPLPAGSPPFLAGPNGEGTVYHGFTQDGSQVWVASSNNFGVTWNNHLVFDGGPGVSYDHIFTWVTVDQAGNVYTVFSDDRNVYYSGSADQGASWTRPIRVNRGGESRTSIFPHVAAGSEGRLVFAWYGHDGSSPQDPSAVWKAFTSRTQNALDPVPAFEEKAVSDRVFHVGVVCEEGFNCDCCRELLECFEIDVHPTEGSSFVTYGSFGTGGTYITRQLSGESAIAGVEVPDRSGTCPSPPECAVAAAGSPCTPPGVEVVTDLDEEDVPPVADPRLNIKSISIAEPAGVPIGDGEVLVFTMKVGDLGSLPPNAFWRTIFGTPGGQFWVWMLNCADSGVRFEYGDFDLGSRTLGPADAGMYLPDGTVQITMLKSKVGNVMPGQMITAVNGDTRAYGGPCPDGPAVFPPVDVTDSGQYAVVGNAYCRPPAVTCAADFQGPPNDYSLTFEVSNPSTATRSFDVTLADERGWLVGGPIETTLGPVAPGQSASLAATVRIPADCGEGETDAIDWEAAADDDAALRAECRTVATCMQVVAVLASPLAARPEADGMEIGWAVSPGVVAEVSEFRLERGASLAGPWERIHTAPAAPGEFRFHDAGAGAGVVHYRLMGVLADGSERLLGQASATRTPVAAFSFALAGVNPVRDETWLTYALPERVPVRMDVYNVAGQRVRTLVDREEGPGVFAVPFRPRAGAGLGAGIYLVRLRAGAFEQNLRVVAIE